MSRVSATASSSNNSTTAGLEMSTQGWPARLQTLVEMGQRVLALGAVLDERVVEIATLKDSLAVEGARCKSLAEENGALRAAASGGTPSGSTAPYPSSSGGSRKGAGKKGSRDWDEGGDGGNSDDGTMALSRDDAVVLRGQLAEARSLLEAAHAANESLRRKGSAGSSRGSRHVGGVTVGVQAGGDGRGRVRDASVGCTLVAGGPGADGGNSAEAATAERKREQAEAAARSSEAAAARLREEVKQLQASLASAQEGERRAGDHAHELKTKSSALAAAEDALRTEKAATSRLRSDLAAKDAALAMERTSHHRERDRAEKLEAAVARMREQVEAARGDERQEREAAEREHRMAEEALAHERERADCLQAAADQLRADLEASRAASTGRELRDPYGHRRALDAAIENGAALTRALTAKGAELEREREQGAALAANVAALQAEMADAQSRLAGVSSRQELELEQERRRAKQLEASLERAHSDTARQHAELEATADVLRAEKRAVEERMRALEDKMRAQQQAAAEAAKRAEVAASAAASRHAMERDELYRKLSQAELGGPSAADANRFADMVSRSELEQLRSSMARDLELATADKTEAHQRRAKAEAALAEARRRIEELEKQLDAKEEEHVASRAAANAELRRLKEAQQRDMDKLRRDREAVQKLREDLESEAGTLRSMSVLSRSRLLHFNVSESAIGRAAAPAGAATGGITAEQAARLEQQALDMQERCRAAQAGLEEQQRIVENAKSELEKARSRMAHAEEMWREQERMCQLLQSRVGLLEQALVTGASTGKAVFLSEEGGEGKGGVIGGALLGGGDSGGILSVLAGLASGNGGSSRSPRSPTSPGRAGSGAVVKLLEMAAERALRETRQELETVRAERGTLRAELDQLKGEKGVTSEKDAGGTARNSNNPNEDRNGGSNNGMSRDTRAFGSLTGQQDPRRPTPPLSLRHVAVQTEPEDARREAAAHLRQRQDPGASLGSPGAGGGASGGFIVRDWRGEAAAARAGSSAAGGAAGGAAAAGPGAGGDARRMSAEEALAYARSQAYAARPGSEGGPRGRPGARTWDNPGGYLGEDVRSSAGGMYGIPKPGTADPAKGRGGAKGRVQTTYLLGLG
eukprot:jgi/Mesvir1/4925/Mv14589-RA.1